MKSVIDSHIVTWLTDQDAAPLRHDDQQDVSLHAVPMDAEVGSGSLEFLDLNLGMNIGRGFHHFNPGRRRDLYPIAESSTRVAEPILSLHALKTGRVTLDDRVIGGQFTFDSKTTFFEHTEHLDTAPLLHTSEDVEVAVLTIGMSTLSLLMGEKLAQALMAGLHIEDVSSALTTEIPGYISSILHSSFSSRFTGDIRKQYAQAKVMEYLCMLANHVTGDDAGTRNFYKTDQVRQLREQLLDQHGKVPSLDELARQYGMSVKMLNDEFKREFGQPIHSYFIEYRLNEAHVALEKSDIPMKVLAARLGYSHVNHFINAFSKKFGYSPGSLRRKIA